MKISHMLSHMKLLPLAYSLTLCLCINYATDRKTRTGNEPFLLQNISNEIGVLFRKSKLNTFSLSFTKACNAKALTVLIGNGHHRNVPLFNREGVFLPTQNAVDRFYIDCHLKYCGKLISSVLSTASNLGNLYH